jgi:hypothetical protein
MNANDNIVRPFCVTPGHGYLRVPLSDLEFLDIENQITPFSYKNATHAFLEEDCDYETYMTAMADKGIVVKVVERGAPTGLHSFGAFPPPSEGQFAKLYQNPQFHY